MGHDAIDLSARYWQLVVLKFVLMLIKSLHLRKFLPF